MKQLIDEMLEDPSSCINYISDEERNAAQAYREVKDLRDDIICFNSSEGYRNRVRKNITSNFKRNFTAKSIFILIFMLGLPLFPLSVALESGVAADEINNLLTEIYLTLVVIFSIVLITANLIMNRIDTLVLKNIELDTDNLYDYYYDGWRTYPGYEKGSYNLLNDIQGMLKDKKLYLAANVVKLANQTTYSTWSYIMQIFKYFGVGIVASYLIALLSLVPWTEFFSYIAEMAVNVFTTLPWIAIISTCAVIAIVGIVCVEVKLRRNENI